MQVCGLVRESEGGGATIKGSPSAWIQCVCVCVCVYLRSEAQHRIDLEKDIIMVRSLSGAMDSFEGFRLK